MESSSSTSEPKQTVDWSQYKPKCEWLDVPASTKAHFEHVAPPTPLESHDLIKILSFNVLAQTLIRREVFPTSSSKALKWTTRKENLFNEIRGYDADIICLQECDFYEEFWKPRVVDKPQLGYGGGYWKRKEGKNDGVAVIWRRSMFEMVDKMDVEYDDYCKLEPYANGGIGCDLSELLRGNVGQIVALRRIPAQTGKEDVVSRLETVSESGPVGTPCEDKGVIIFNTHLFWNPRYNYVRLVQCVIALEQIMKFKEMTGLNWPVVMCGDYNHSSGDPSYEALFERQSLTQSWDRHECWLAPKLHYSKYQGWIVLPPQNVLDAEEPKPREAQDDAAKEARFALVRSILERFETFELPLPISVYRNYIEVDPEHPDWEATHQPSRLEPPFTSYSSFWCGPLDYIAVISPHHFSSANDTCALLPQQLMRTPRASEVGPPSSLVNSKRIPHPVELPNDVRASDHLPIMASFVLTASNPPPPFSHHGHQQGHHHPHNNLQLLLHSPHHTTVHAHVKNHQCDDDENAITASTPGQVVKVPSAD